MNFVAFTIIYIRLEFHESIVTKHDNFCLFCKMVINKKNRDTNILTEVAHTNASIDF